MISISETTDLISPFAQKVKSGQWFQIYRYRYSISQQNVAQNKQKEQAAKQTLEKLARFQE